MRLVHRLLLLWVVLGVQVLCLDNIQVPASIPWNTTTLIKWTGQTQSVTLSMREYSPLQKLIPNLATIPVGQDNYAFKPSDFSSEGLTSDASYGLILTEGGVDKQVNISIAPAQGNTAGQAQISDSNNSTVSSSNTPSTSTAVTPSTTTTATAAITTTQQVKQAPPTTTTAAPSIVTSSNTNQIAAVATTSTAAPTTTQTQSQTQEQTTTQTPTQTPTQTQTSLPPNAPASTTTTTTKQATEQTTQTTVSSSGTKTTTSSSHVDNPSPAINVVTGSDSSSSVSSTSSTSTTTTDTTGTTTDSATSANDANNENTTIPPTLIGAEAKAKASSSSSAANASLQTNASGGPAPLTKTTKVAIGAGVVSAVAVLCFIAVAAWWYKRRFKRPEKRWTYGTDMLSPQEEKNLKRPWEKYNKYFSFFPAAVGGMKSAMQSRRVSAAVTEKSVQPTVPVLPTVSEVDEESPPPSESGRGTGAFAVLGGRKGLPLPGPEYSELSATPKPSRTNSLFGWGRQNLNPFTGMGGNTNQTYYNGTQPIPSPPQAFMAPPVPRIPEEYQDEYNAGPFVHNSSTENLLPMPPKSLTSPTDGRSWQQQPNLISRISRHIGTARSSRMPGDKADTSHWSAYSTVGPDGVFVGGIKKIFAALPAMPQIPMPGLMTRGAVGGGSEESRGRTQLRDAEEGAGGVWQRLGSPLGFGRVVSPMGRVSPPDGNRWDGAKGRVSPVSSEGSSELGGGGFVGGYKAW